MAESNLEHDSSTDSEGSGSLGIVQCTACLKQINPNIPDELRQHPVLKVLICKKCYNWYTSDEIEQDENGIDEQCRWCGDGGNLICCDMCHNAFCKKCIKQNLGRKELSCLLEADEEDKWSCYVCNPAPLSSLVKEFNKTQEVITNMFKKKHKMRAKRKSAVTREKIDATFFTDLNTNNVISVIDELLPAIENLNSVLPSLRRQIVRSVSDTTKTSLVSKVESACTDFVQSLKKIEHRFATDNKTAEPMKETATQQGTNNGIQNEENSNVLDDSTVNIVPNGIDSSPVMVNGLFGIDDDEDVDVANSSPSSRVHSKKSHTNNDSKTNCRSRADMEAQRLLHRELLDDSDNDSFEGDRENTADASEDLYESDTTTSSAEDDIASEKKSDKDYNPKDDIKVEKKIRKDRKIQEKEVKKKKIIRKKLTAKQKQVAREKMLIDKMKKKKHRVDAASSDSDTERKNKNEKQKTVTTDKSEEVRSVECEESYKNNSKNDSSDTSAAEESEDMNDNEKTVSKSEKPKGRNNNKGSEKGPENSKTEEISDERVMSENQAVDKDKDVKNSEKQNRNKKDEYDNEDGTDEALNSKGKDSSTKNPIKAKQRGEKSLKKHTGDTESENSGAESETKQTNGSNTKSLNKKKNLKGEKRPCLKLKKLEDPKAKEQSTDKDPESDSSGFDDDLEKEIDKLSNLTKVKKTKSSNSKKTDSNVESSNDAVVGKDKQLPEKKRTKKGKTEKISKVDALDSDDSPGSCTDVEDMDVKKTNEDDLEQELKAKSEQARLALLQDDDSENDDNDADSESMSEDSDSDIQIVGTSKTTNSEVQPIKKEIKKEKKVKAKKGQPKDKLLTMKLSSSDSDVQITRRKPKGKGSEKESDDSDVAPKKRVRRKKKAKSSASSSDSSSDSDNDEKKKRKGKGKKRRRIKTASSSGEDKESGNEKDGKSPKKKVRKILKDKNLSETTKSAAKAEEERRARIKEIQQMYNQITEDDTSSPVKVPRTTKLALDQDEDGNPLVEVNKHLIKQLKPHQVEAVKFMWECTAESVERLQKEPGSGCILAHCMGLGKTLSVITFGHTVLYNYKTTKMETLLVICPLNTVLNWQDEWAKWVPANVALDIYEMSAVKSNDSRIYMLQEWIEGGGVMIMGYEMYRNLSTGKNMRKKKQKEEFYKLLVDPGPDLIVCDEGHILKNSTSATFKAVNAIRTKRRIVLTGTPLQNNLNEYHCMVDFVKENLLGSRKEFANRFVNPITFGQCSDSTSHAVKVMKKRAHILHETLAGCVQRKDYSALTKYLLPKYEYVISVRLSDLQIQLYEKYLDRAGRQGVDEDSKVKGSKLFADYQFLKKIFTHPWTLKMDEIRQERKNMFKDEEDFIDDAENSFSDGSFSGSSSSSESEKETKKKKKGSDSDVSFNSDSDGKEVYKRRATRSRRKAGDVSDDDVVMLDDEDDGKVSSAWWAEQLTSEDEFKLSISGKLVLMAEILKMCENIGDKVLIFSQSLLSLDLIEKFLWHWDEHGPTVTEDDATEEQYSGCYRTWVKGADYFRMDGSTNVQNRRANAEVFNDPDNHRARLFLISTRAGGLGTNMIGANRAIIFDASWNPTHDTQSIFRVYRFGQDKPCYIYRFVAQGTMEEKIYERQVTKLSLSQRVVDEHQIERHFTQADLAELYKFNPDRYDEKAEKKIPILPKDRLLADLLTSHDRWIVDYHEHDSLLENKVDEELSEEDRKAAWEEYEAEKKGLMSAVQQGWHQAGMQRTNYQSANTSTNSSLSYMNTLARSIFAANPGISQDQVQQILVQYMQKYMQSGSGIGGSGGGQAGIGTSSGMGGVGGELRSLLAGQQQRYNMQEQMLRQQQLEQQQRLQQLQYLQQYHYDKMNQ